MKKILPILFVLVLASGAFAAQVWDPLRSVTEAADTFNTPIKMLVFLLAAAIFAISLLAYSKSKSKRILLVSLAFLFFSLKWLVKIIDIFYSPGNFLSDASENVFELGILLSLLVALFYRKSWSKFFDRDAAK